MLLPFSTFGEIAALGLEAHVWCLACKRQGRIDPADDRWSGRLFAGARLRCSSRRLDGARCHSVGVLSLRPAERIPSNSGIEHACMQCLRCVPFWEILDVRLDRPPWSALPTGARFTCPGCRGPVSMVFHGGAGIPYTDRFA